MNDEIKKTIEKIVIKNKETTFDVNLLFNEVSKILDIKKYNNIDLKCLIRSSIDDLSKDSRFYVNQEERIIIKFNANEKKEPLKKLNSKQYFCFFIFISLAFFSLPMFIENTFLFFCVSSLLSFSFVLFYNEYNENKNELANKIAIIVPVFGFLYYVLSDPFFSNYSNLTLDGHIEQSQNIYYFSISLFLSIFIIVTMKDKLCLSLAVIMVLLLPFFEYILTFYMFLICVFLFICHVFDKKKELESLTGYAVKMKKLYDERNIVYVLLFSNILGLYGVIASMNDELKQTYYKHITEENMMFCNNLNYDFPIIKTSSKSNNIVIFSDNLYNEIGVFLFTQNEDVLNLKPLDNDAIITKSYFLNKDITYNTVLLSYQNILNKKEESDLIKEINEYIKTKDKDYIEKNNKIIQYYLNNHDEGQLFFYKCD